MLKWLEQMEQALSSWKASVFVESSSRTTEKGESSGMESLLWLTKLIIKLDLPMRGFRARNSNEALGRGPQSEAI